MTSPGLGTEHREAEDAVVVRSDERFHESSCLTGCLGAEYSIH